MKNNLCFVFHSEKCIQCHGCETACKTWNNLEPGIQKRFVRNIWVGTYPDITCSTISTSCLHCLNPACMEVCPVGAISKNDTNGVVSVNASLCIGCQACKKACPYDMPEFDFQGKMQKCDMCQQYDIPPCVKNCPTNALELKLIPISEL